MYDQRTARGHAPMSALVRNGHSHDKCRHPLCPSKRTSAQHIGGCVGCLFFCFWQRRKAHEMRSDAKPPAIPPLINVRITSIGWFAVEPRIPVTGMYDGDVAQNPH